MPVKCIMCQKNPIQHVKRKLCNKCYSLLYRTRNLPPVDEGMALEARKNSLIKKHGKSIIADLARVAKLKNGLSLTDLSKKYGFTREYARQIYFTLYGIRYTEAKKLSVEQMRDEMLIRIRKQNEINNALMTL